jgi:hypothetical protein
MSEQTVSERGRFRVRYVAGPYSGYREVDAEDAEQAEAVVRRWVRKEMSLPMYAESYHAEPMR